MADGQIDLGALNMQQLEGLKEQLEAELDQFAESFQQLQAAANRFHMSGIAAECLSNETAGACVADPPSPPHTGRMGWTSLCQRARWVCAGRGRSERWPLRRRRRLRARTGHTPPSHTHGRALPW